MKIEVHSEVLAADLPSIYAFIARDNPTAAEQVLEAVDSTFAQLEQQPECGVIYATRTAALQDLRMLPVHEFANYLVFYRVEADAVRVLYVLHGARNLVRLFRREPRS